MAGVYLQYSTNGLSGPWHLIDIISGNPGYYDWEVPLDADPSNNCYVRIGLAPQQGDLLLGVDRNDDPFTFK